MWSGRKIWRCRRKKYWENGDLIGFDSDFMGFYSEPSDFKGDFMMIL
jgi:hypothetical protein